MIRPSKRAPLRRVGRGTHWKKSLDALCRQVVFARDSCCQWCRKDASPDNHWAHIRSRRYLSSRWDTRNSLRLCAGCHLRWHHQPLIAAEWFKSQFPSRWQAVMFYDHGAKGGKIDRESIRLSLLQELKKWAPGT